MSTKTYKVRFFAPTILTPTGARFETSFFDLVMAEHDRQSAGERRDCLMPSNRSWTIGAGTDMR